MTYISVSITALSNMARSELKLDNTHKVITVILNNNFEVKTLINCGASGLAFIEKKFVKTPNLLLHKLKI